MSLTEALALLRLRKWLVGAVTVATAALGAVLAYSSVPVYRAETLLVPVTGDADKSALAGLVSQFGGLAGLGALGAGEVAPAAEYVALIQSPQFVSDFIRREALLPILFADQWDGARSAWRTTQPGAAPSVEDGYRLFTDKVMDVKKDRDTGIVTLTIEWIDPGRAAKWANDIVATANEQARTRAIDEANASLEYLRSELGTEQVMEVKTSIYKLVENQLNTVMLASGRKQYAFRVISAAAPSDQDHFVRPKRGLMIVLSVFLGVLLAAAVALVLPSDQSGGKRADDVNG